MADSLDLSIVIVSYNTLELTRKCLRSVYDNTNEVSFEVWVVDNASADGSADMIEAEFPDAHLIRNEINVGLAAATNQGLEPSTGRYVLTLNSDTLVQPDAFDTLVKFMDEHPDAGAATPRLEIPDGNPHTHYCGNIISFKAQLLFVIAPLHESLHQAVYDARGHGIDYSKTQEVPCILMGTALIVRREVYETVGGQDPRFFVYAEDVDWTIRIAKAGWKQYIVTEALVLHYGGSSTKQSGVKMNAQLYRSKCRYVQKHFGLFAGLTVRGAAALVSMFRWSKWAVLWLVRPSHRESAAAKMEEAHRVLGAVLRY